jgi:hypothetical protein
MILPGRQDLQGGSTKTAHPMKDGCALSLDTAVRSYYSVEFCRRHLHGDIYMVADQRRLVAVVIGLVGSIDWNADVIRLVLGQLGQFHT